MGFKAVPAAAGPGAGQFAKLKPGGTRWVLPGWYAFGRLGFNLVADRIYYIPILVEETTTYIRIGVNVTATPAGTVDLRIYAWNNGVPGSLILDAGAVDTSTLGAKEITISKELTLGYYFLAFRGTGTPKLSGLDVTYAIAPPVAGYATALSDDPYNIIMFIDAAFADPAPAPATTGGFSPAFAMVFLRES